MRRRRENRSRMRMRVGVKLMKSMGGEKNEIQEQKKP